MDSHLTRWRCSDRFEFMRVLDCWFGCYSRLSRDPCRACFGSPRWTPATSPLDWTSLSLTRMVKLKSYSNASGVLIGCPTGRDCPRCIGESKAPQPWCLVICVWKDLALSNPAGQRKAELCWWPGYPALLISVRWNNGCLSTMWASLRVFEFEAAAEEALARPAAASQPSEKAGRVSLTSLAPGARPLNANTPSTDDTRSQTNLGTWTDSLGGRVQGFKGGVKMQRVHVSG